MAEWKVPAEGRPPARHEAAQVDRHVLRQLLHGELGAQVVGDRVEPARVHQPRARLRRPGVVAHVHQVHELGLAGQVGVVGARLGAGGHQRLAVVDVGAHRGDHDPCGLGQLAQRGLVG